MPVPFPRLAIAMGALALTLSGAATAVAAPVYDEAENVWFSGRIERLLIDTPGPDGPTGPSADRRDVTVYAIGPIDPAHPQGAGGTFPLPPGSPTPTITIPQRDVVLDAPIVAPADCFGSYVRPGPRATARKVFTRTDPNGSGITLAWAIDLGWGRLPLTSYWAIAAGVQRGLLVLDGSLGYGGTCVSGRG